MIDAVLLLGVWSLPLPVRMAIAALVAHHYFLAADAERREGEVSPLGLSLMDIIYCVVVLMNTLASFSDIAFNERRGTRTAGCLLGVLREW